MKNKKPIFLLGFMALGVVYGDIGTSPLYAINEIFFGHGQASLTPTDIFGALSLIFWALTIIVTIKYVVLVLRAEYDGEGGILALLGLVRGISARGILYVSAILVLAAGFLFGDGVITPAISVLSAVEGLTVGAAAFKPFIIPITIAILTGLFAIQYKGSGRIGKIFGGIMVAWFFAIGVLGLREIIAHPMVLAAVNPWYGLSFLIQIGVFKTMLILGAVVLVFTGGEALYADLGHFGVTPIRLSWLSVAFPALILNYFGQGAYLLSGGPVVAGNVFFSLVPHFLLIPMVLLATLATIVASQALISGAFSLIAQAVSLNLTPAFRILHTSDKHEGQIYIPAVNWALYISCVILILIFKSSTNLASAYGLAETGVMLSTSMAMIVVAYKHWHWSAFKVGLIFGSLWLIDLAFFLSNSVKFLEGGYVPFGIGISIFAVMMTWQKGRDMITRTYAAFTDQRDVGWIVDLKKKIEAMGGALVDERGRAVEINRAVIFMSTRPIRSVRDGAPIAARFYIKRNGGVPKCMVMLNIKIEKVAFLEGEGYEVIDLGNNIFSVNAKFGFMEKPDVRTLLKDIKDKGLIPFDLSQCTLQVAEPELILGEDLPFFRLLWANAFKFLSRVSISTYRYFGLSGDANLSLTLVPLHITKDDAYVIRLNDQHLMV